jgi:hypothetical protein
MAVKNKLRNLMLKRLCAIVHVMAVAFVIGLNGALPDHVKNVLDKHNSELRALLTEWQRSVGGRKIAIKSWLPRYVIKHGIERIPNAGKLRNIIQHYNLDLVSIPHKYVYQVFGGKRVRTNQNCVVIAEKIKGSGRKLNLEQVKQLYCAAVNAPHYDLHDENYIVAHDGKVYIIDTDYAAMLSPHELPRLRMDWMCFGKGLRMMKNGYFIFNDPSVQLQRCPPDCTYEARVWLSIACKRREIWRKLIICDGCIIMGLASCCIAVAVWGSL